MASRRSVAKCWGRILWAGQSTSFAIAPARRSNSWLMTGKAFGSALTASGFPSGRVGRCGHAPRVFSGVVLRKGRRSNSGWRAFSQFDAYHHVLWTTATSVGQAGTSPSQCARGLVTRHTPVNSQARATLCGSPALGATVLVTNLGAGRGPSRPHAPSHSRSKRSLFMTLSHAATKSRTNFAFESSCA